MLATGQFDGASLFSGGGLMPSQATQAPESLSSPAKTRRNQRVLPLTVKQISEAYHSSDDKSNIVIDGVDATNVRLLGLVTNKTERAADVSFTLDDGTGRIDISRWMNETSDANEVAEIQGGIYVIVSGHLKGFQAKGHAFAFSVRPVTDYNDIVLHFIECIYVHLENTRRKVHGFQAQIQTNPIISTPFSYGVKGYQAPPSNQFLAHSSMNGSGNDIYKLVLGLFLDPSILAYENGLHVNEVVKRLGIPKNKIMDAINYHVDIGNIYATIDEYHFKSSYNGC